MDVCLIELLLIWVANVELCSGLRKVIQVSLPIPLPVTKWVDRRKLIQSRMCSFCDLICITPGMATSSLSTLTSVISLCWHPDTNTDNELPQRGHVVIPFVGGYNDIAGKVLKLDHIEDPNHRPLDILFRDHFLQCVLKNMKGVEDSDWDYEEALGDGSMDLSRHDIWGGELGKAHFEFEMAHRLHDLKVAQDSGL